MSQITYLEHQASEGGLFDLLYSFKIGLWIVQVHTKKERGRERK